MSKNTARRSANVDLILSRTKGLSPFWERPLKDWDEAKFLLESDFDNAKEAMRALKDQYILLKAVLKGIDCPERFFVEARLKNWKNQRVKWKDIESAKREQRQGIELRLIQVSWQEKDAVVVVGSDLFFVTAWGNHRPSEGVEATRGPGRRGNSWQEETGRNRDEDEAEADAGGIEDDDSSDVEPEKDEDTNVEGDNAKEKDQNRFEVAFSLSSNEDFVYPIDDDQSLTEVAVKCRLPKRQRRPLETISVTASAPAEMPGTKELSEPVYADDNNGDGGDEVISVEINSIMEDLRREPLHEWIVDGINVTQKFREYQQQTLKKLKDKGLTWKNNYEILALSAIMVFHQICPYPNFTRQEWQSVIKTNPYGVKKPIIPDSLSTAFHDAIVKHSLGEDSYMIPDSTDLSRAAARTFNELRESVPLLAPSKTSEDEHCVKYLHNLTRPLFLGLKDYEAINQQLSSRGGPGESVLLNNFGDIVQTYVMDLKHDGMYRSWPFLTSKLVIDQPSMPLIESSFSHFVALERHISALTENFKKRPEGTFTPPLQIQYMREIPNSPQIRRLLN
ncbi:hypothetical protein BC936DRAFT_149496 [Jimgerdemannia flammicorona]|uniref:Uncharacterized protein n=1 Tax=Jimgerdemannia flammicorona TaxID=994334 RepID=A0A433D0Q6_9FUNG|nr:hypothetical protein BC936DRAFT_149496 [Jimgerdemannia flammicorona]